MRYIGGGVGHTIVTRVEEDTDNTTSEILPEEDEDRDRDVPAATSSDESGDEREAEDTGDVDRELIAEDEGGDSDDDDGYEGFAPL